VILCGPRKAAYPELSLIDKPNIKIVEIKDADEASDKLSEALYDANVIVDAIFGTGQNRPLSGLYAEIAACVNKIKESRPELTVYAIDVPTGVNSDDGTCDENAIKCDHTITLGLPKRGLFETEAAEKCGTIMVSDIFFKEGSSEKFDSPTLDDDISSNLEYLTDNLIKKLLPKRTKTSHKGTFGKLISVTGSEQYPGAAVMSSGGALRAGAGIVTLHADKELKSIVATVFPEVTYSLTTEDTLSKIETYSAILGGCGLGQSKESQTLLNKILPKMKETGIKGVIDADGLNLLSQKDDWFNAFEGKLVLTPHVGEMARLLNIETKDIVNNRIETARKAVKKMKNVVLLKGAYTVIASPDGRTAVSPFANPVLATAGTGDVLAGIIAGFLAQGLAPYEAAVCGVYIHGKSAGILRSELGEYGIIASDIITAIPHAFDSIIRGEF
jgi:NAD(P)H-hydrate epimerase